MRRLLRILSHENASNIRPVWLTRTFHPLCVFASGDLRCISNHDKEHSNGRYLRPMPNSILIQNGVDSTLHLEGH
jgi:hypothetical protein